MSEIGFDAQTFEQYVGLGLPFSKHSVYVASRDLELEAVVSAEVKEIEEGRVDYWHSGIPCKSWSVLRFLAGQSSRSFDHPWGDGKRECEVRALVLRPQAASRRVLASHFPLGPLAHIGRLAGTPSPRLCGGDASPGCTQIAAERHIAPCAPTVASLPPPLLRTLHQCVSAGRMPRRQPRCSLLGSFASPAKSSSEATAVWALHQPSSPFEDGIGVARGICADRELRRRSCASGRAKRSPSDRLPL